MSEQRVSTSSLQGKRILVTRTGEQATTFSERLRELGALPIEFATIRIAPPLDWEPLDSALRRLNSGGYDWVIFTSANGVRICLERLRALHMNSRALADARIAAIGPATAAALETYGLRAALVPGDYIAEAVAAALIEDARLSGDSLVGKRILLPRAAEARNVLVTDLQNAGAIVQEVAAYRTLPVSPEDEQGRAALRFLQEDALDILTFTSSSTARNFMQWLSLSDPHSAQQLCGKSAENQRPVVACIGPITAQTARDLGLTVQVEARTFTIDGLIEAVSDYYEERA